LCRCSLASAFCGGAHRFSSGGRAYPPTLVTAQPSFSGSKVAVDDATLFIVDDYGALTRVELAGGTSELLRPRDDRPSNPSLALDDTSVYLTLERDQGMTGEIVKIPRLGGVPITLVSSSSLIIDVAVDANNAYWTELTGGVVRKVPLAGGTPVILASGSAESSTSSIAVNATGVFWIASELLMSTSLDGDSPKIIASGVADELAVDETNLYWIADGEILQAPVAGGPAIHLAANQDKPGTLTVDATSVYWVNQGSIWKRPASTKVRS